ncbi:hypothetical protein PIB30_071534 [Stylosanthes scabra]|uniref:FAR1 domain-containing protein n=1 Tax=Stylosanthes scabra TaxID=79078 RepID=A0ABU6TR44_9FABA|nr:hypothetical protein [Stylosanthes scabra]
MATPLSSFYSGVVVVSDLRHLQQLLQEVLLLQELLLREELLLCSKRSSSILKELTNVRQEQHHEVPSTEEALQHEDNVNGEKIIANQSILCNKHGNLTSRVLAPIRSKKISSEKCKARVYVKLDKEKGTWFYAIFEAKHTHACSPQKSLHYHEYRELNMHAKCVIEDNDEVGIKPNKTYLALSNEVGGSSNLNFSEKDVRNYITCKLRTSDPTLKLGRCYNISTE